MNIQAIIKNKQNLNEVLVSTNGTTKTISIPSKSSGFGSGVSGGELLLLALATCYCNDIYREAAKMNITVTEVKVDVTGDFGAAGEPGKNFCYRPSIQSNATPEQLQQLIEHTDRIAEIHKTLREGLAIKLLQ